MGSTGLGWFCSIQGHLCEAMWLGCEFEPQETGKAARRGWQDGSIADGHPNILGQVQVLEALPLAGITVELAVFSNQDQISSPRLASIPSVVCSFFGKRAIDGIEDGVPPGLPLRSRELLKGTWRISVPLLSSSIHPKNNEANRAHPFFPMPKQFCLRPT